MIKNIFKKVIKDKRIFTIYIFVISILFLGVTYAINTISLAFNLDVAMLAVDEEAYGDTEFDASKLDFRPILDSAVETSTNNVIKIDFTVGGASTNNNDNIIYDIALNDLDVNCNLLSPYLKWKLIKNDTEISNGSLDYKFDKIKNGRLVLTNIQQDLIEYDSNQDNYDKYTFYMWLSDSCQADLSTCIANGNIVDQSSLLGQSLSGKIEVELYAESKKELTRTPTESLDSATCTSDYFVIYNFEDGTDAKEKVYVVNGENYGQMPTPTKENYVFGGWFTKPNGQGTKITSDSVVNLHATQNLFAYWFEKKDIYYLSYNLNGGNFDGSTASEGIVDEVLKINNPVKVITISGDINNTGAVISDSVSVNQTFSGWTATDLDTTTAMYGNDINSVNNSWNNGNLKVMGTYFKNLSSTNDTTVTLTANWNETSATLPTISKVGYSCSWNTAENGSGTSYVSGDSYTVSSNSPSTVTVYAQCNPNVYTVNFYENPNYVYEKDSFLVTIYGRKFYKRYNGGALAGYLYDGILTGPLLVGATPESVVYYTSDSIDTDHVSIGSVVYNGNTYYYSNDQYWFSGDLPNTGDITRPKYIVSRDSSEAIKVGIEKAALQLLADHSSSLSQSFTYDTIANLTDNSYVKTGYTFDGWTTTSVGSGASYDDRESVSNLIATSNGSVDLYAKWSDKTTPTTNVFVGEMLYTDPEFASGVNSTSVYNNSGNGSVTVTRTAISGVPNSSGYGLEIKTTGTASPGHGGFTFKTNSYANCELITRIIAKIPVGYKIQFATNTTGDSAISEWLTSRDGTGDWAHYVYRLKSNVSTGTFSTTNFFYVEGGSTASTSSPVTWNVAYATVIDTTAYGSGSNTYLIGVGNDFGSRVVGYNYTTSGTQPSSWNSINTISNFSFVQNVSATGTYYAWFKDAAGNINNASKNFGLLDTTNPIGTISTTSTLKSASQTATIKCTDSVGVNGYYWGTTAPDTFTSYTSVTGTTSYETTKSVTAGGTYYLSCRDYAGNISTSVNKVYRSYGVYNMFLKAAGTKGTYNTTNYDQASSATYVVPDGTSLTLASIYTAPTGSTFAGFSSGVPGTSAVSVGTSAPTITANSSYGMWFNRNEYAVSYNANGGSNAPATQTKRYGVNLTLSSTIPTKSGFTFLGWATSSNATSASVQPGGTYSSNAAVTYYAVWTKNLLANYTAGKFVSYTGNNGCTINCNGENANYVSSSKKGYCASTTSTTDLYKTSGWVIAYVANGTAYLTSAGAPNCVCGYQKSSTSISTSVGEAINCWGSNSSNASINTSTNQTAFRNLIQAEALKYCNTTYAYGGSCSASTTWAMNGTDFQTITGSTLATCYTKSSTACGKDTTIINTGSKYWYDTVQTNYSYLYTWRTIGTNNTTSWQYVSRNTSQEPMGIRPVIRLKASVCVTGGSGTEASPYTIAESC